MNMEDCKKKKADLRKELIKERNNLNSSKIKQFSGIISDKIIDNQFFQNADNILVYISYRNEVDISAVINKAWDLNKRVLVPKTDLIKKHFQPYVINSWDELEIGNYQLFEPIIKKKEPFPVTDIDVVLIPGVGFDKKGYRLGYGGGFYDRFLTICQADLHKIGVAYDFQIIDELPVLEHDCSVDEIITEKQILVIK